MVPVDTVFTPEQPGNATANIMIYVCLLVTIFFILLTCVTQNRGIT